MFWLLREHAAPRPKNIFNQERIVMDPQRIFAIERPHSKLMTYYLIQSIMLPPISLLALPYLYFRYHTMRYQIDDEGISMRWGILFRKQINLTYARIQDIHLTSGVIQRWLGLADIHIQTASGSASAEMKIEGLLEYEEIRDFLYSKMRGYRQQQQEGGGGLALEKHPGAAAGGAGASGELAAVLREVAEELRATRAVLEARRPEKAGPDA